MTEWILIVVSTAFGFTATFSTEEACLAAAAQVESTPAVDWVYANAECYPNNWH